MAYTIDIDTGGTFTDGYVSGDGARHRIKVDTTPHDLTEGLMHCLQEASRSVGLKDLRALLKHTEVIRLSTTLGINTLLQRNGPKLGLIVTRGQETALYGGNEQEVVLDFLVNRDMVLGIQGQVGPTGEIEHPIDETEVKAAVKELLVRGARSIVVSLLGSPLNPQLERQVRRVVEDEYPRHYLGSVPVSLSTEVTLARDDASRTNVALLDAYMHREMARYLYRAEENLRNNAYHRPLLNVHNWGGVARVAKTKAINTYSSGPTAGMFGATLVGQLYGIPNVVSFDVGGTSVDVGLVVGGRCPMSAESEIGDIPIKMPLVEVYSVGAGGGSIARAECGTLRVGPESAGAMPGPACYDLGGDEATATDACVVLGYVNPDYFLGGRRRLNGAKAFQTLERNVARPLGLTVEQAALDVTKSVIYTGAEAVQEFLARKGVNARDVVLLAFGGAGGLYACGTAREAGIRKVLVPPLAAIFSAFGSSTMNVVHEYEAVLVSRLRSNSGETLPPPEQLSQIVARLVQAGTRDMRSEGFGAESITFSLELELSSAFPDFTSWVTAPSLELEGTADTAALLTELQNAYAAINPGEKLSGAVTLEGLKLRAYCPLPHAELPTYPAQGPDPADALKGTGKVFWDIEAVETPVYEHKRLQNGNVVVGPAIVEGEDTTVVVPKGWTYTVDQYLFGVLEDR